MRETTEYQKLTLKLLVKQQNNRKPDQNRRFISQNFPVFRKIASKNA